MGRLGLAALLGWVSTSVLWAALPSSTHELSVDFGRTNGFIRPLHGVNSGPLCYRGTVDLTAYHRELGIPLTRLHDVPWVNAEAVDIHTIFPDFHNDPEREESYRFAPTDDYIGAITNVPSQIVYRLGESIEHTARKYHVHPPADPAKWAAICLGIIRHYNEGWAHGFHHGIRFWEIWNEPDVRPAMWTGTDEQFFELYETAAKAIKQQFPALKVGGPAAGGTGDFTAGAFKPSLFLARFLKVCHERQAPLDFLSWHRYTSQPWDLPVRAHAIRALLDQNGFTRTESHLNEWNYLPNDDWAPMLREGQGVQRERWSEQMAGPAGAAFAACALILLQDAPLDAANFYTGEIQGFGLFSFAGVPKKNFYAFKAFRQLLETPVRAGVNGELDGAVALLAGIDGNQKRGAVLISHFKKAAAHFNVRLERRPWPGSTAYEVALVDEQHNLERVTQGSLLPSDQAVTLDLPAPAVALISLKQE